MRTVNEEARRAKEIEIMEACFDCYAENGFTSVGVKTIAKACDCSVATLYQYFDNLDDLIVKSTNTDLCIRSIPTRNTENTVRSSLRVSMNDIPNMPGV